MNGIIGIVDHSSMKTFFQKVLKFDEMHIKPVLAGKEASNRITMRLRSITLDEHYTRLYGPSIIAGSVVKSPRYSLEIP